MDKKILQGEGRKIGTYKFYNTIDITEIDIFLLEFVKPAEGIFYIERNAHTRIVSRDLNTAEASKGNIK